MPRRVTLPCEDLRSRYEAGQSTIALAKQYGCSPTTVAKQLRACGVAVRPARFRSIPVDPETLRRLYLDERRPIAEIAARLAISPSTIGNKRQKFHIPTRHRR